MWRRRVGSRAMSGVESCSESVARCASAAAISDSMVWESRAGCFLLALPLGALGLLDEGLALPAAGAGLLSMDGAAAALGCALLVAVAVVLLLLRVAAFQSW